MNKKFVIPLVLGALVFTGCQHLSKKDAAKDTKEEKQEASEEKKGIEDGTSATPEAPATTDQSTSVSSSVSFVMYENKVVGYSLQRPEKWYWQHFLRKDLNLAAPQADDVLIVDPQPLQTLTSDWYGQMAVEVGRRDLTQHASDWLKDFAVSDAMVGGAKATRYEGLSLEKGGDMKVIEYHLMKGQQSVRLIYNKIGSMAADEEIFQHLVQTFAWNAGK